MIYFLSIIFSQILLSFTREFVLEAGNFMDNSSILQRSNASNFQSVRIGESGFVYIEFCLPGKTVLTIKDIVTSNDGNEDQVDILLDGELIGIFKTRAELKHGYGWNIFKSSGQVARPVYILAGKHTLVLNVSMSDYYGIEIDAIKLDIKSDIPEDIFQCKVFCFDYIDNAFGGGMNKYSSKYLATIKQVSHEPNCAEEDNINVPFYFYQNTHFEITASHPKYKSMINSRKPDFTNCATTKSKLWSFKNITIPSLYSQYTSSGATLNLLSSYEGSNITIHFPQGSEEIGCILHLRLKNVSTPIQITMWYKTKSGKNVLKYEMYSPSDKEILWTIPDYTWAAGLYADIGLLFPAQGVYFIEYIYLHPRGQAPDHSIKIFENHNLLIEGLSVDFWWKETPDMQVTRTDIRKTYNGLNYVRIYTLVPWSKTNKFSKVFVLYGDGFARMLPITPPGYDEIPFGSSLLIGRSDPTLKRPSAPISHIHIDPKRLVLTVNFFNHDIAFIDLKWTFDETVIKVDFFDFARNNLSLPILTYRAMWISDGNADVDSLKVDNKPSVRIHSKWKEFNGTSFTFYRRCLSSRNTQSPDITVRLLSKENL